MSAIMTLAEWVGIGSAGVALLVAAWYGRKGLKVAAKASTWATIALAFLVALGLGAIIGWWELNLDTIASHLGVAGRLIGDLAGWVLEQFRL